jgi:hypothetical protein
MKVLFTFILIAVLTGSCSKDDLLVDQYKPQFTANPLLTSNYCRKVVGVMQGEQSALIYTGRYGLYTEDDFKTMHYNKYDDAIECFGTTVFFDGLNVWTVYHELTLGWRLTLSTPDNPRAKEIEPYHLRQGEFISPSAVQVPTVLGVNSMVFTAYRDSYESDNSYFIDVYSFIDDEVEHLTRIQSDLLPKKIFRSDDHLFLLAKKEITNSTQNIVQSHVYVSSDARAWNGPFMITENEDITQINNGHGITVAYNASFLFTSMDYGKSWIKRIISLDGEIQDVAVPDDHVIYAVIGLRNNEPHGWISKLAKSSDDGSTWQIMEKEFYGEKISFFDREHGIAMAKGTLQVTHDGGNTWKLILVSSD